MKEIFTRQQARALQLRTESIANRRKRLKLLEEWVLANRLLIQDALAKDFQKVPQETDLSETYVALTEIRQALKHLRRWSDPRPAAPNMPFWGTKSYVQYEPKGVCLIISPWNFPFQLALGPLISALAAGNTVILKPSEYTPATAALLNAMMEELFTDDLVMVIQGDASVAQDLLSLPFNHIFFTGSPHVGKIVMKAAAANLASVTLELGGKSPVFIDESANINDTAQKLAWAKWMNSGQTCTAPDYVLVHEKVKDELLQKLKVYSEKFYGGGGKMTGIINEKHRQRLTDMIQEAKDLGAVQHFGQAGEGIAPTVLTNVATESSLLKEEIFGPVLPITEFRHLDDAIARVNKGEKPLALYVFSKNRRNIKKLLKETSSGSVAINDAVLQFGHPELPFGGVNNSGFGKSHGESGFRTFSNEKSVLHQRIGLTMAKTLYPPYSFVKNKTIDLLLRFF